MVQRTTDSPIDDIAYLARSEHRVPTLAALTVRPRSRSELWELTGVSSSTIRRTLSEFEDRNWIVRDGYRYETTQLGAFIASEMADLIERFDTEQKLRNVWSWLPDENTGFSIEFCTEAEVTEATGDQPYRPVNRFKELLEGAESVRFALLDVALLEPCKDDLCTRIVEGMETEIIDPPRVIRYIRTSCAELFEEAFDSGNLTVRVHDDLPSFGLAVFDDRVAVIGYDNDGVTVRVLIDTDEPDARAWATERLEMYNRQTPTISIEAED